jgi:hypothetical protein
MYICTYMCVYIHVYICVYICVYIYTCKPYINICTGAVGKGFITVVRNNPFWKQPYTGITQIVSGEIAEDMAHYLTDR